MEYINNLFWLCPVLFFAGVLDGIAGGGGIIALPAYLMTGMPVGCAYACNKLQSFFGTTASGFKYIKEGLADIKIAIIASVFSILASFTSTRILMYLDEEKIKNIIIICVPLTLIMIFVKETLPNGKIIKCETNVKNIILCGIIGLFIGSYDGFFGPGGGTIAMIIFSLLLNYDLRVGCGNGKIIIVISNLTAMINYIIKGYMIYYIAVPCAIANIIGSYIGATLAVKNGKKVILPAMITVVISLVTQFAIERFV